jgi:hypothetical protein
MACISSLADHPLRLTVKEASKQGIGGRRLFREAATSIIGHPVRTIMDCDLVPQGTPRHHEKGPVAPVVGCTSAELRNLHASHLNFRGSRLSPVIGVRRARGGSNEAEMIIAAIADEMQASA